MLHSMWPERHSLITLIFPSVTVANRKPSDTCPLTSRASSFVCTCWFLFEIPSRLDNQKHFLICPVQTVLHQQYVYEVCLHSFMFATQAPATQKYLKNQSYFIWVALGIFSIYIHTFQATYAKAIEIKSYSQPDLKPLFHLTATSNKYRTQERTKRQL